MLYKKFNAPNLRSTFASFALAIVGTSVSLLAYKYLHQSKTQLIDTDFQRDAYNFIASLEREIAINLSELESTWGLYIASDFVSREEFKQFTTPIVEKHKSIQAIEWAPRVPYKKREQYVKDAQESGLPSFDFIELNDQGTMISAKKRNDYFPIYYIEPHTGNERALGFDLASNPARKSTLDKSAKTGKMLASTRTTLVQKIKTQFSFLVFKPLFSIQEPETIKNKEEALLGFIIGVYRISDLFQQSINYLNPKEIDICLFDMSAPKGNRLIHRYSHEEGPLLSSEEMEEEERLKNPYNFSHDIDVAGVTWKMWFKPTPNYIAKHRDYTPLGALIIGLLLTGTVSSYLLLLAKREKRITAIVQQRTKELSTEITERKLIERQLERSASELKTKNDVLENDLVMARELQQAFVLTDLPTHPQGIHPNESHVQFGRIYIPSGAVGGDYIDIRRISKHKIGVFMGDVSGHGLRAALVVSSIRGLLEQLSSTAEKPGEFITKLNKQFSSIFRIKERFMFVSCFYCVLDFKDKQIYFTNAGHPPPYIINTEDATVSPLNNADDIHFPAVGLTPDTVFETRSYPMQENDLLFLYTDGIYEALNDEKEEYGLDRLKQSLKQYAALPPNKLLLALLENVKYFAQRNEFEDDVCILTVGFNTKKNN